MVNILNIQNPTYLFYYQINLKQWENNNLNQRQSQNFSSQNNFFSQKENTIQPTLKNYVLGEKHENFQYYNENQRNEFQRGIKKGRTFGRVLNDNGVNQLQNSQFFMSQPIIKQFKNFNPFQDNLSAKQQNEDHNKENVQHNNLQCEMGNISVKQKFLYQVPLQEVNLNNKSTIMVDESVKDNQNQKSSDNLGIEVMNKSQIMVEENQITKNQEKENENLRIFDKVKKDNSDMLKEFQFQKVNFFDRQYLSDPIQVAEYAHDIFEYLSQHQDRYVCKDRIDLNKMHNQVHETMRCMLIDWLTEVSLKYELKEETQFMCIQLLDIYCRLCYQDNIQILRENYQKVGVSCLYIASKIEEIYPPSTLEFVTICDGAYKLQDVIDQEKDICLKIQFNFSFPTPFTFFVRYSKILGHDKLKYFQGLFILYLCQMHYELSPIYIKPSLIASCSCFIVESVTEELWDNKVKSLMPIIRLHLSSEFECLMSCIHKIVKLFKNPQFPFGAIRKKFSTESYGKVSTLFSLNTTNESITQKNAKPNVEVLQNNSNNNN